VTLRQWTSEGKIKVFITPGGHRRYAESELRRFMGTRHLVHGIRDLVAKMELAPAQELQIAQTHFSNTSWYSKLDPDSRDRLRELGRRMHHLVITYVSKQNKREATLQAAREVGSEFATRAVEMGLSLTDSLEAFLLHRAPLINAATDVMKKGEALNERAVEAMSLVSRITDEALLSLVEAYQNHNSNPSGRGSSGKT